MKVGVFYPPATQQSAAYTLRLYFAEPQQDAQAGDRIFGISIQGKEVLPELDIAKAAGGPRRGIVKEFHGVRGTDSLLVEFTSKQGEPLLCGLEAIAEDSSLAEDR